MTIWQGTYYNMVLNLVQPTGAPANITGWTFKSHIRDKNSDKIPMIELTTENGGIAIIDAGIGRIELRIFADQNRNFSLGNVVGDIFRTDISPGPERLFGFRERVRKPVTREAEGGNGGTEPPPSDHGNAIDLEGSTDSLLLEISDGDDFLLLED